MRAPRCRYRCRQPEHRRLPALHRRSPGVQAVLLPGLRIADRKRSRARERSRTARHRASRSVKGLQSTNSCLTTCLSFQRRREPSGVRQKTLDSGFRGNDDQMTAPRTPRERVPYLAIVDRPPLVLADDARMIVWTIVNVEDWGIEWPMPRTVLSPPMGQPLLPALPNWGWHEDGMRVGFWRLFECMRKFGVTPTLAINGVVCRNYPRIAQAAKDAGWEFMGHGWLQQPLHQVEDQRAAIRETMDAIRAFTGRPPRGWESPGLAETFDTIDSLAEAGIEYVADWVLDDQPVYIATAHGPMLSVPYTVERS